MYLKMGNLTVAQFAERVDAQITPEEIAWLEDRRTSQANFTDPTKFHIFDDPAVSIVIGADCMTETLPLWKKLNERKVFSREVGFYPARKHECENASTTEPS